MPPRDLQSLHRANIDRTPCIRLHYIQLTLKIERSRQHFASLRNYLILDLSYLPRHPMIFVQDLPSDPGNCTTIVNSLTLSSRLNRFREIILEHLMDKFWCWKNKGGPESPDIITATVANPQV